MNAFNPIISRMAAKADSETRVYLPDSNTEATAFFELDWNNGDIIGDWTCKAVLIGLLIGDEFPEVLTQDDAVNRFGLNAVRAWETQSAEAAMEDN